MRCRIENDITNFSISESALHKLALTSKNLERLNALSTNSIGVNGNNSTSSTVEESAVLQEKTSPNRRRRLKLKKKSLVRDSFFKYVKFINRSRFGKLIRPELLF